MSTITKADQKTVFGQAATGPLVGIICCAQLAQAIKKYREMLRLDKAEYPMIIHKDYEIVIDNWMIVEQGVKAFFGEEGKLLFREACKEIEARSK